MKEYRRDYNRAISDRKKGWDEIPNVSLSEYVLWRIKLFVFVCYTVKGAPFVNQCSNHLTQRWAQARAEQGNAAAGISPMASRASCFPGWEVWETKDRARTKIDVRKVPGWDLPFPGWRRKRGRRSPRTAADGAPLKTEAALRMKAAGCFLVFRYNTGVPCLTLCPRSWGAHDNLQFPSQTESEDQRAGADWRHERPSSCKFHIRAVYSTDQL